MGAIYKWLEKINMAKPTYDVEIRATKESFTVKIMSGNIVIKTLVPGFKSNAEKISFGEIAKKVAKDENFKLGKVRSG